MNETSTPAQCQPLPLELDADRSSAPCVDATAVSPASTMSDGERVLLAGMASELAELSNRAEHASVEVAAIEALMHGLADQLTAAAGITLTDGHPHIHTDIHADTDTDPLAGILASIPANIPAGPIAAAPIKVA